MTISNAEIEKKLLSKKNCKLTYNPKA